MSLCFQSAPAIADAVNSGQHSATDVVDAFLDRVEERNDVTNSYITVLESAARERAREIATAVEDGDHLPLAGVPVGMKDLEMTKEGVTHTMGLVPFADNVASETSTIIQRLEDAGAIIVGTTNTPELGYRVRTDNPLVGPTATPFDTERNAGGSSGGSAAALADGLCTLATGSDIGGSLRNPASCCGVTSIKPSFGVVPRDMRPDAYGGYSPFSVWGPMARDIESLAVMLDVIAGQTHRDPTSVPTPDNYADAVESTAVDELSVAYSPDLDMFAVESRVKEAVESTLDDLSSAGATVEEVTIDAPAYSDLFNAYSNTVTADFATHTDILNEHFGIDLFAEYEEVSDDLEGVANLGRAVTLEQFREADRLRTALYDAIDAVLSEYDALACPALATPPLTHDEPFPTEIDGTSVGGFNLDWTLSWPFNLTGHPVVAVPADPVDGLPVGMQLVGRPHSETRLLQIGAAIEAASPWDYPDAN